MLDNLDSDATHPHSLADAANKNAPVRPVTRTMSKPLKSIEALAGILLGLCWNFAPTAAAATVTAISPSYEDVSAAVSQAHNGDTVQIPSGSATWSSALDVGSKSINIIGTGSGSTILNGSTFFRWKNTGNNPIRVSAIRFNSADKVPFIIGLRGPIYKFRADHCIFNKGDSSIGTNWYTETGAALYMEWWTTARSTT